MPETKDPVLAYLREQMHLYGYDMTDCQNPERKSTELVDELRTKTAEIVERLLPGQSLMNIARFTRLSLYNTQNALKRGRRATTKTSEHCQIVLLQMLLHISGIRDTLSDIEREIWVAIQLSHDPRYHEAPSPPPQRESDNRNTINNMHGRPKTKIEKAATSKRKAELIAQKKEITRRVQKGLPMPKGARTPVVMPFRALRALNLPESNLRPSVGTSVPGARKTRDNLTKYWHNRIRDTRRERIAKHLETGAPVTKAGLGKKR